MNDTVMFPKTIIKWIRKMKKLALSLFTLIGFSTAHAAEPVVMTLNGQFGQIGYTRTADGWVSSTVSVDGVGLDKTAYLFYTSYNYTNGYKFWRGAIPMETVTQTGVASISVDVNTCNVEPLNAAGCGPVSFTVNTDEPASGWVDNGTRSYSYDDYIYNSVGARQVRFSSASGSINGSAFDSSRAYMGKFDKVTIQVTVGN